MVTPKGFVVLPLIVAREKLLRKRRARVPERMVMVEYDAVEQFDRHGHEGGSLLGPYELVARATSKLAPRGAVLLDLGCGPARYVSYLARRRPDLKITGLDLSDEMLAFAARTVKQQDVADRITLMPGDMTDFIDQMPPDTSMISSEFALHHLPEPELLDACLSQIAEARKRTGCGVLLFDMARLKHSRSWSRFIESTQPPMFHEHVARNESNASEAAAWSYDEFRAALKKAGLGDLRNCVTRPFGGFQMHWAAPVDGPSHGDDLWQKLPMPLSQRADVEPLKLMLRGRP